MIKKIYSIIDIETTGGHRNGNKITEIAIIKFDGEKVIDQYSTLINPERNIPVAITYLTGINNEMVAHAPRFYEVAKKIIDMTKETIFVAHNVFFDFNFIKHEFAELGYQFKREKICTVRLARKFLPGHKSYSLGKICADLGISIENRHRALGDALATVELLKKIIAISPEEVSEYTVNEAKKISLPKNLSREDFDNLPHHPGVYYFYDQEGQLLYIGKSKDIKKRVSSHFRPNMKRRKDIELKNLVAKIEYKLMGNELAALLYECHQIKKYKPHFNTSLKRIGFPIAVDLKENKDGVYELKAFKREQDSEYHYTFSNKKKANLKIASLYKSLLSVEPGSLHFDSIRKNHIKTLGKTKYNQLLQKIFYRHLLVKKDYVLNLKGRTSSERAFIIVHGGRPEKLLYKKDSLIKKEINLNPDQDMVNIFIGYQNKHSDQLKKSIVKN